jgi:phospho-N-acetylmuramoyl-pentapeptide-transferase
MGDVSLSEFLICTVSVFALTVLCSVILIPVLRAHKVGQMINDYGPKWHEYKSGTPTMGGICFIFPLLLTVACVFVAEALRGGDTGKLIPLAMTVFLASGCAAVGFIDDYRKLVKKQNEGLRSYQKMLLLLLIGTAYLTVMGTTGYLTTEIVIPYANITVDLGWGFWPLALLCVAGMTNSTNITDGVDGLAATVTLVVVGFFTVVAFFYNDRNLSLVGGCMIGAMIGFLIFNFHPAKVMMGDTGSLFLGGMIMGTGFMIGNPIVILIASLLFILEALSSAIQIVAIDVFHKKVFPMAPLHHTLELKGWSEVKIVAVAALVTAVFCVISWFGL